MKIYTRNGDNGTCGLFSGERVAKSHDRINAFGEIDELNSALGVLLSVMPSGDDPIRSEIQQIQCDLLDIGAWLATSRYSPLLTNLRKVGDERVSFLEAAIDQIQEIIGDIDDFILPGGHEAAAYAHLARAICRRAERRTVGISVEAALGNPPIQLAGVIQYLNRLSDFLYVLGRYFNHTHHIPERLWKTVSGKAGTPSTCGASGG